MYVQIDEAEDPFDFYKALAPEPPMGEIVGRIAFLAASLCGAVSFVPAALKKTRIYTFIPGVANIPVAQEEVIEGAAEAPRPMETPRCTPAECEKIRELFTSIADGGADLVLPWVAFRLHQLGNQIEHVHPFSLLLAMPKEKMRQILMSENPLKINSFIGGLSKGMAKEIGRNGIHHYLASFSAAMEKQEERIRQLIQAADWLGLVQYLFDTPAARAG